MYILLQSKKLIISLIIFCGISFYSIAQNKNFMDNYPEIEVIESYGPSDGYYFIASEEVYSETGSNYIAIFDHYGTPVFFKNLDEKARNFKLQPNGLITYISGNPKTVYILDSAFNNIDTLQFDDYQINDNDFALTEEHHAVLLAYNDVEKDMSLIVDGGDPNAIIRETSIVILDENRDNIFTWNSSDYYDILDANEESPYVDLKSDFIDYVFATDFEIDSDTTILLCSKHMDEITRIDRRSGDIIWRLGGENNQFTFIDDDIGFSHPTQIARKENGNLLIYDSGLLHENPVSSVKEYIIDEEEYSVSLVNTYKNYKNIVGDSFAGFQCLENNNILAHWGDNKPSLTEFHANSTTALMLDFSEHSYGNEINKFKWETNLFKPVVDSINFGMWNYTVYRYLLILENNSGEVVEITSASNHSEAFYLETDFPVEIYPHSSNDIMISYFPEMITTSFIQDVLTINADTEGQRIAQQVKLVGYRDDFIDPEIKTFPEDGDTNIPVDTMIIVDFNEPIRFVDSTEITNGNVSDLFALKLNDENGENVEFYSTISTNKDVVRIIPVNNFLSDQQYYFEMLNQVVDYYNNPANEFNIHFSTKSATNIENISSQVSIFPNPAAEIVEVNSDIELIKNIRIFDMHGRLRYIKHNIIKSNFRIDVKHLDNGFYIIIIDFGSGNNKSAKFIKN